MRALLFHCKNYKTKFDEFATRPHHVKPECVKEPEQSCADCILALVTVEEQDAIEKCCSALAQEIAKMSQNVGHKNIVIIPFAHLSNRIADSEKVLRALEFIVDLLKDDFNVLRAHFGSHKSLLLDIYGHPGNVRYREF